MDGNRSMRFADSFTSKVNTALYIFKPVFMKDVSNISVSVGIAVSVIIVFQAVGIHVKGNQVTAHVVSF